MRKHEQPFLLLDTNILIWGLLQSGDTPKAQKMVEKATSYLDKAAKEGQPMAISIVTVGWICLTSNPNPHLKAP